MRMILKIIFLVVITICAIVSVVIGRVISGKDYQKDPIKLRKIVRVRMACFLIMLIFLLIIVVT